MRLLLGCVLLLMLPMTYASKTLEIDVNQQKVALPYWSPLKKTKGGILVIYGDKPIYGQVLGEDLGQHLADLGWTVVLINAQSDKQDDKWVDQIPEALAALRMKENNRLIVIHYGEKLFLSLDYFAKPQSKQVNGLVLLSAYDDPVKKESLELLGKLSFPTYDITGQFDYEEVAEQAKSRREANSQDSDYRVLLIPGARHQYLYALRTVAIYLHGWMLKLPQNEPAKPPIVAPPQAKKP